MGVKKKNKGEKKQGREKSQREDKCSEQRNEL